MSKGGRWQEEQIQEKCRVCPGWCEMCAEMSGVQLEDQVQG